MYLLIPLLFCAIWLLLELQPDHFHCHLHFLHCLLQPVGVEVQVEPYLQMEVVEVQVGIPQKEVGVDLEVVGVLVGQVK